MSLYQPKDSTVWWASITLNGERVRFSTGEYDRQAALKVHDQRRAAQHDQPKLKGTTWGSAVMKWVGAETRSDSDIQSLAKFGRYYKDRPLSSVTADSIDEALKKFVKSDGTYNRYATTIAALLTLSRLNIKVTRRRDKTAKTRDWLTHEQWKRLRDALPQHQKAMATFAVTTGLRQANVLGLLWEKVDLERKLVWVEAEDAKGGKAIAVPLSKGAVDVLRSAQRANPIWVFTFRGQPVSEIKTAFQAACVRAGVGSIDPALGVYSGFTWHGLRHTWATWHVQNGTPLEVLQKLGAWADLRMVMRYAHHSPGHLAGYADNLGDEE